MSTEEPALTFGAGGEQIRQREFATVRRGYDPAQVRAYLTSLAAHVESLERSLAQSRSQAAELEAAAPASQDPYERLSKRFAGVLVSADSEAAHIVEQARTEAEHVKAEAQARAEEARIRSSQSVIAAQEDADRMLANLAERRAALLAQLHEMQSRLLSVAEDLEVAILPSSPEAVPPHALDRADIATSQQPEAGALGVFDEAASDGVEPAELTDLGQIDLDFDVDDRRDLGR